MASDSCSMAWEVETLQFIERIHPRDLQALTSHALSAPGIVFGRALRRHWPGAVGEDGFFHTLDASWTGLRNYLDQRWFFLAFRQPKEKYPEVIHRLILEGNLESVLDEHLWIIGRLGSLEGAELAKELRDGLSVKSGLFFLREIGNVGDATFALRCHVAMPFIEARAGQSDRTASAPASERRRGGWADPQRRAASGVQYAVLAVHSDHHVGGTGRPRFPHVVRHHRALGPVPESRRPRAA